MKHIVMKLALIGLVGTSTAAFAQHGPPPSVDQRVQRMTEQLSLTVEQQPSARALLEANLPKDAERAQHRAAIEAGLKAILTESQYVEFEADRQNRDSQRRGPRRAPEGKGRGGAQ